MTKNQVWVCIIGALVLCASVVGGVILANQRRHETARHQLETIRQVCSPGSVNARACEAALRRVQ